MRCMRGLVVPGCLTAAMSRPIQACIHRSKPSMTWHATNAQLAEFARKQLFFVGGAPRSGTTWLQQLLDAHPEISCAGEGLFWRNLAVPLDQLAADRTAALQAKNTTLFRHTGGYGLPPPEHTETLLGTGILLALQQQSQGRACLAVGEKTPENVFLFPRLKRIFPDSKLIAIARDPRDVLASAWHIFHKPTPGEDQNAAKKAFLRLSLPSMAEGARAMQQAASAYPAHYAEITYETLQRDPVPALANLFRFLGVDPSPEIAAECLARTRFTSFTGGRPAGTPDPASFFRNGRSGDWGNTLDAEMNEIVLQYLGWSFPNFGWRP